MKPDPNKPIERDRVVKAFEVCKKLVEVEDTLKQSGIDVDLSWPLLKQLFADARDALGKGGTS